MKFIEIIYFLVLYVGLISCNNERGIVDCRKFCTSGTLEYLDKSGQIIIREDTHIETFEKELGKIISEIHWLDNCIYYLKVKEITFEHPFIVVGDSMYVKILGIKKDKMIYMSSYRGVEVLDSLYKKVGSDYSNEND